MQPQQEPPGDPVDWRLRLVAQLRSGEARQLREQIGMSQDELAGRLQVARLSVVRWENGQGFPRDIRVIVRWSNVLTAIQTALGAAGGDGHPPPVGRPAAQTSTTQNTHTLGEASEAASLPDQSAEGRGDNDR
jgi:transcriptional regulator with XRE-family HTH domain